MSLHRPVLLSPFQVQKRLMTIDEGKEKLCSHTDIVLAHCVFPRNDCFSCLEGNLSCEQFFIGFFDFRQKALKALDDRMKSKEPNADAWPELDEAHSPVPSAVTINMNKSNELTPSITKEEST